jgi:hypothetical protein
VERERGGSKSRSIITLSALPADITKVLKLPVQLLETIKSNRDEIYQEIIGMRVRVRVGVRVIGRVRVGLRSEIIIITKYVTLTLNLTLNL